MTIEADDSATSVAVTGRTAAPVAHRIIHGVHFLCGDRIAVLTLEEAMAMLGVAKMIGSRVEEEHFRPERVVELAAFTGRLEAGVRSARKRGVVLEVDRREVSMANLLVTQTRARADLDSRLRFVCTTCHYERLTNPEYQQTKRRNEIMMTLSRSVGVTVFSHGVGTFFMFSSLLALVKLDPDFVCRNCEGTKAMESVIVFCPSCHKQRNEAVLRTCPACGHDFIGDVDVAALWQPRTVIEAPVVEAEKVLEFRLGYAATAIAFTPDGQRLAVVLDRQVAEAWAIGGALALGHKPSRLWSSGEIGPARTMLLAMSGDGEMLAVANKGGPLGAGKVRLLSMANGAQVGRLRKLGHNQLADLDFAPTGRLLAVAMQNGVELWDAARGKKERTLRTLTAVPSVVGFSPDGQRVAADGWANALIWEVSTGKRVHKLPVGSLSDWTDIAWTPDGDCLMAAGIDKVKTCRVSDDSLVDEYGFAASVTCLALSPDGERFAVGCKDKTVRLVDVATGGEPTRIDCGAKVNAVAFSPLGHLAVALEHGAVQLWSQPS